MSTARQEAGDRWADAVRLAAVVALAPAAMGGAVIRCAPGPVRDRWLDLLKSFLPADAPFRRLPVGAGEERIFGGLDVAATLAARRPVHMEGLVAAAAGGVLVVPMAERIPSEISGRLALAVDRACRTNAAEPPALVALDEGVDADEQVPAILRERAGAIVTLDGLAVKATEAPAPDQDTIGMARGRLPAVACPHAAITAICEAAVALGVSSLRASSTAVWIARGSAALDGRAEVSAEDLALAARLVLAPRATQIPAPPGEPDADESEPPQQEAADPPDAPSDGAGKQLEADDLTEIVLDAAVATLPEHLTSPQAEARPAGKTTARNGRNGRARPGSGRGRLLGASRRPARGSSGIDVIATLKAAAPWQPLRSARASGRIGLVVHPDDLRYRRRVSRTESTVVFAVDASGSSALHRLAEAKGAVELLLARCYVRRESVALVAFRKKAAELLLPPTRSLARARRSLSSLPGGGATPLASGLDMAAEVVRSCRRRGQDCFLVILTDAKANVTRDGRQGRSAAEAEAEIAARGIALDGTDAVLIDIGPRPSEAAARLARAMHADYRPLPHADSRTLHGAVTDARSRRQPAAARGTRH